LKYEHAGFRGSGFKVQGLLIRFLASGYLLLAAGNWFLAAAEGCPTFKPPSLPASWHPSFKPMTYELFA
jgi:hypothetical protein